MRAVDLRQDPTSRPLSEISPWFDQQLRTPRHRASRSSTRSSTVVSSRRTRPSTVSPPTTESPISASAETRATCSCRWTTTGRTWTWKWCGGRDAAVGSADAEELLSPVVARGSPRRRARPLPRWVDNPLPPEQVTSSLRAALHHVETFWQERDATGSTSSTTPTSRPISPERWSASPGCWGSTSPPSAYANSAPPPGFEAMKERSRDLVPNPAIWRDADAFFHQGGSGQSERRRSPTTSSPLRATGGQARPPEPRGLGAPRHRCEGVARDAIRDVRRGGDRRRRGRPAPRHGHEVVFIARGAHYEAIRESGLRFASPEDRRTRCTSTSSTRPTGSTSAPATWWCSR